MKRNPSSAAILGMRAPNVTHFDPTPFPVPDLEWPTRARSLFSDPDRYIARTRANPDYGKPGWTRDCGRRFHRGLDIAPIRALESGARVIVHFSDCATGREYPSEEPAWIPDDEIFAVLDGVVVEVNRDPDASDFGLFVAVRHEVAASHFFTLYAHLDELAVSEGETVAAGVRLGKMGQTSRSADARAWMAVAPHLHIEVIAGEGGAHDPLAFLREGLRRFRPGGT